MDFRCVLDINSRHRCLQQGHSSITVASSVTVTFSLLAIKITEPIMTNAMPKTV